MKIDGNQHVRECSCGMGDPMHLHRVECERLIDIVLKWKPSGYVVVDGRVVRPEALLEAVA